jgi:hypothetical protein
LRSSVSVLRQSVSPPGRRDEFDDRPACHLTDITMR